jgi:hypothetical protein
MASRCCVHWAFTLSAQSLKELCGVILSPPTLCKIAYDVADSIAESLPDGSVLEEGAGEQNGGTLCRTLRRPMGTRMEKVPLNFYAPSKEWSRSLWGVPCKEFGIGYNESPDAGGFPILR